MIEKSIKTKLDDITLQITDGTHSTVKNNPLGNNFLLSCKNIKNGRINISLKDRKIDNETLKKLRRRTKLEKNDVVITTVGTIGEIAIINENNPIYDFQRSVGIIKPNVNNVDPQYLYYYMNSPKYQRQIKLLSRGAAQQCLFLGPLKESIILINTLEIQKKIASILLTYDKLIENNTRQIEILEEISERLYSDWFVDFKYPGHENDELVKSELGMIPEGWKLKNLNEYVSFDRGTEPGSKNYLENYRDNTIRFLRVGDLGNRNNPIFIPKELSKNKILKKDDIVITLDGTVGIVKTGFHGCFSTGLRKCTIVNNVINKPFLFYTLKSKNIQSIIKAHATGSTILHASSSIKYMKFAIPSIEIMDSFLSLTNPILEKIQIIKEINSNLINTRDYLLPKLISGKVDVSDLDININNIND